MLFLSVCYFLKLHNAKKYEDNNSSENNWYGYPFGSGPFDKLRYHVADRDQHIECQKRDHVLKPKVRDYKAFAASLYA